MVPASVKAQHDCQVQQQQGNALGKIGSYRCYYFGHGGAVGQGFVQVEVHGEVSGHTEGGRAGHSYHQGSMVGGGHCHDFPQLC